MKRRSLNYDEKEECNTRYEGKKGKVGLGWSGVERASIRLYKELRRLGVNVYSGAE